MAYDPWLGAEELLSTARAREFAGGLAQNVASRAGTLARGASAGLGPASIADTAIRLADPLKLDEKKYYDKAPTAIKALPVSPPMLGATAGAFGIGPNAWNPLSRTNSAGKALGSWLYNKLNPRTTSSAAPAAVIPTPAPTQAIKGDSAYEGFDDQYTSFATRNAQNRAIQDRVNASTPDERIAAALSPNPYGTKESYFNNAGIKAAGYDQLPMNTMSRENVIKSGYNDAGVSAALQAAAARGDWDAVGRYYASKGEKFAGRDYGNNAQDQLMRMAMGGDGRVVSRHKRDRAALLYNQMRNNESDMAREQMRNALQREITGQQTDADRFRTEVLREGNFRNADIERAKLELMEGARTEASDVARLRNLVTYLGTDAGKLWYAQQPKDKQAEITRRLTSVNLGADVVEGKAEGGVIHPVTNPMGNMGMPSSMATLDPAVRQYAQYVSTATQYGLQPVAFPKFIDLLGAARTKLMQMPTQGGQYSFADGGEVSWWGRLMGDTPERRELRAWAENKAKQDAAAAAPTPAPSIPGAIQSIQGRNAASNSALEEAMASRRGYAGGGAVGPFGDFSRASRRLDTTRAGEDPYTYQAKVDELVRQYVPNAVPGAASPDEFTRLIQAGLAARKMQFPTKLPAPWGTAKNLSNYAGGGAIPVAGQQVLGPGGPKSDSIPAVIDGTRPAALSSGEFVFPTEAVQYFGTDKLNKMIQKARGQ